MKTHFLLLAILLSFTPVLHAQEETTAVTNEGGRYSELSSDAVVSEIGFIPEIMDANVDSLLHTWHVQFFSKEEAFCHDDDKNVYFPDSIYRQRLESLPNIVSLPYNKIVRDCIDLYAERRRGLVRYLLGMADYYFPIIEQALDEQGLPLELKYLAVVESALNPVALSRVGASGMWQFMLPTAKGYGLEINSLVDERRDPVRSTYAACQYLKDMYAIYEDWTLVLAAYNCGPGNVNKALRRAGGKTDFWEIYQYLPKETRSYVPLFIAANYILNFYCDHNLCPVQTNLPLATDTVMINRMLHMEQVSDVLNIDMEQLQALNPQYKRNIVPGSELKPAVLKLPAVEAYAFVDKTDTIFACRAEELLGSYLAAQSPEGTKSGDMRREKITHVTVSGENLYTIANKYGVTAANIRKWNGLASNRVGKGKRLTVYIDNGGVKYAANSSSAKSTQHQAATVKQAPPTEANVKAAPMNPADQGGDKKGYVTYTVRSGDSLYTISKKYPGISTANIQKANNLSNSRIKPGQVLRIPVG